MHTRYSSHQHGCKLCVCESARECTGARGRWRVVWFKIPTTKHRTHLIIKLQMQSTIALRGAVRPAQSRPAHYGVDASTFTPFTHALTPHMLTRAHINGHHHLTYKRARKHTNLLARHATTHAVLILCIAGTPLISASTWSLSHLHTSHAYAHYSRVLVTRLSSIFVVPSHTLHTTTVLVRLSSLSPSGHCVGPFVLHRVSLFIRV